MSEIKQHALLLETEGGLYSFAVVDINVLPNNATIPSFHPTIFASAWL